LVYYWVGELSKQYIPSN